MAEDLPGSDRIEHSLARSVLFQVQRTRDALSPWARNWLPAALSAPAMDHAYPFAGSEPGVAAPQAAGHPRMRMVQRLASTVAGRYPDFSQRYGTRTMGDVPSTRRSDLALPTAPRTLQAPPAGDQPWGYEQPQQDAEFVQTSERPDEADDATAEAPEDEAPAPTGAELMALLRQRSERARATLQAKRDAEADTAPASRLAQSSDVPTSSPGLSASSPAMAARSATGAMVSRQSPGPAGTVVRRSARIEEFSPQAEASAASEPAPEPDWSGQRHSVEPRPEPPEAAAFRRGPTAPLSELAAAALATPSGLPSDRPTSPAAGLPAAGAPTVQRHQQQGESSETGTRSVPASVAAPAPTPFALDQPAGAPPVIRRAPQPASGAAEPPAHRQPAPASTARQQAPEPTQAASAEPSLLDLLRQRSQLAKSALQTKRDAEAAATASRELARPQSAAVRRPERTAEAATRASIELPALQRRPGPPAETPPAAAGALQRAAPTGTPPELLASASAVQRQQEARPAPSAHRGQAYLPPAGVQPAATSGAAEGHLAVFPLPAPAPAGMAAPTGSAQPTAPQPAGSTGPASASPMPEAALPPRPTAQDASASLSRPPQTGPASDDATPPIVQRQPARSAGGPPARDAARQTDAKSSGAQVGQPAATAHAQAPEASVGLATGTAEPTPLAAPPAEPTPAPQRTVGAPAPPSAGEPVSSVGPEASPAAPQPTAPEESERLADTLPSPSVPSAQASVQRASLPPGAQERTPGVREGAPEVTKPIAATRLPRTERAAGPAPERPAAAPAQAAEVQERPLEDFAAAGRTETAVTGQSQPEWIGRAAGQSVQPSEPSASGHEPLEPRPGARISTPDLSSVAAASPADRPGLGAPASVDQAPPAQTAGPAGTTASHAAAPSIQRQADQTETPQSAQARPFADQTSPSAGTPPPDRGQQPEPERAIHEKPEAPIPSTEPPWAEPAPVPENTSISVAAAPSAPQRWLTPDSGPMVQETPEQPAPSDQRQPLAAPQPPVAATAAVAQEPRGTAAPPLPSVTPSPSVPASQAAAPFAPKPGMPAAASSPTVQRSPAGAPPSDQEPEVTTEEPPGVPGEAAPSEQAHEPAPVSPKLGAAVETVAAAWVTPPAPVPGSVPASPPRPISAQDAGAAPGRREAPPQAQRQAMPASAPELPALAGTPPPVAPREAAGPVVVHTSAAGPGLPVSAAVQATGHPAPPASPAAAGTAPGMGAEQAIPPRFQPVPSLRAAEPPVNLAWEQPEPAETQASPVIQRAWQRTQPAGPAAHQRRPTPPPPTPGSGTPGISPRATGPTTSRGQLPPSGATPTVLGFLGRRLPLPLVRPAATPPSSPQDGDLPEIQAMRLLPTPPRRPAPPVPTRPLPLATPPVVVVPPAVAKPPVAENQPPPVSTTAAREPEPEDESTPALNLDDLARQIMPRVKRMLAVERERRPAW